MCANNISRMVITFIDGMFLGNVLLEIKLANHLKGGIHGSVPVQKKNRLKTPLTYTSVITYYN